jgi:hypothetical protein
VVGFWRFHNLFAQRSIHMTCPLKLMLLQ